MDPRRRFSTTLVRNFSSRNTYIREPYLRPTKRWQSTSHHTSPSTSPSHPFWSTARVLLFTTFTGTCAYLYGINDTSTFLRRTLSSPDVPSNPVYGTPSDIAAAVSQLRSELSGHGPHAISTDPDDLRRHGFSAWSNNNISTLPVAVAYPRSTADVQNIARVCSKYKVPMIPYSGGSSLEANFSAPFGGVSIDFVHMNQIVQFREEDLDVTVQPAVGWMDLNEKIKQSGLFFPVDPGPTAMIGGMVATACSGTNAFRYGTMKDWVVNLTVVLADGTVIKTRGRPRKTAAGYNLTALFVGSEGTLGIVTEITLRLAPIPQRTSVAVVGFPSVHAAASCAQAVIRSGIPVAAMEIMDDVSMNIVNRGAAGGAASKKRQWKEVPTLFFKFSGTPNAMDEHISLVRAIAQKTHGADFEFAVDEAEQMSLWSARKDMLPSLHALKKEGQEFCGSDVAVPVSRLADLIAISKRDYDALGIVSSVLGHVGDGNFHQGALFDARDPEEKRKVMECMYRMVDRALEMEGTCTGEHGVGMGKKESLVKELGLDTIGVMKKIKASLDPYGLMNPGKVFDL